MMEKTCVNCGDEFETDNEDCHWCSESCWGEIENLQLQTHDSYHEEIGVSEADKARTALSSPMETEISEDVEKPWTRDLAVAERLVESAEIANDPNDVSFLIDLASSYLQRARDSVQPFVNQRAS